MNERTTETAEPLPDWLARDWSDLRRAARQLGISQELDGAGELTPFFRQHQPLPPEPKPRNRNKGKQRAQREARRSTRSRQK